MHSSRMRTVRSSSRLLGGVCLSACWDTPLQAWTWTPPGPGHPLGLGLDTPAHVNRMTDRCKNITIPQLRLRTVITLIGTHL